MSEPERPPPTYATRPAVPPRPQEQPPYYPPKATLQGTPLTSNHWPVKRGMGLAGGILLGLGAVLFLLGGAVAFSATSLFVCIFFTGIMVTGAVQLAAAAVIGALR
jgi:hypothetical protein